MAVACFIGVALFEPCYDRLQEYVAPSWDSSMDHHPEGEQGHGTPGGDRGSFQGGRSIQESLGSEVQSAGGLGVFMAPGLSYLQLPDAGCNFGEYAKWAGSKWLKICLGYI